MSRTRRKVPEKDAPYYDEEFKDKIERGLVPAPHLPPDEKGHCHPDEVWGEGYTKSKRRANRHNRRKVRQELRGEEDCSD